MRGWILALALLACLSSGCHQVPLVDAPLVPRTAAAAATTAASARDQPVTPRTLDDWHEPSCSATPGQTVKVAIDGCLAKRQDEQAWQCLQRTAKLLDCGLRAEAHLLDRPLDSRPCETLSEPPAADEGGALTAGRRLQCVLERPAARRGLANNVRAANGAARELWSRLEKHRKDEPLDYSLVARGGVSLGNWQSGVLFYLSEVLKLRRDRIGAPSFTTVTGASAGAVNALASAIASCERPLTRPEDSLYYQTWINLGLFGRHGSAGLLPETGESTRYGVFNERVMLDGTERGLAALRDSRRFVSSSGRSCQVRLGLTVTYLDERTTPVHFDDKGRVLIQVPRLKERFALQLDWQPRQSTPVSIANLWPGASAPLSLPSPDASASTSKRAERQFYALLGHPDNPDDPVAMLDMMKAVQASGAFPVAFPPVLLKHRDVTPQGNIGDAHESKFVDGGALDNTPIGLAIKLDEWDALHDPNPYFAHATLGRRRGYVFVDANATSWQPKKEPEQGGKFDQRNVLDRYIDFGGTLIGASLQASLQDTVERWPFIQHGGDCKKQRCLLVPTRSMPITASLLGHFMAFLERDFRIFDYFAGMADGARFVRSDKALEQEVQALAKARGLAATSLEARMLQLNSPEFRCMLDYVDRRDGGKVPVDQRMTKHQLPQSCWWLGHAAWSALGSEQNEAIEDAILRITVPHPDQPRHQAERLVGAHNFRALIVAMHNYHVWALSDDFDDDKATSRFFAELAEQNYRYVDIPKRFGVIETPGDGKVVLRRVIHQATEALANAQPTQVSRATVRTLSRFGGDLAAGPIKPRTALRVGVAPLGLDAHIGVEPWRTPLRPELGVRVYRIAPRQVFPNERPEWLFDFTGYARLTVPVSPKGVPWLRLEPSIGAVFSETMTASEGHGVARVGVQNGLTAIIGQRFWLELDFEHFFEPVSVAEQWSAPGVAELISPRSRLSGAVGWQIFW